MTPDAGDVLITAPGIPDVRLGPLPPVQARRFADSFREEMSWAEHPAGAAVSVTRHEPARCRHRAFLAGLPRTAEELAAAIAREEDERDAGPTPFPGLFVQLRAVHGRTAAARMWLAASRVGEEESLALEEAGLRAATGPPPGNGT